MKRVLTQFAVKEDKYIYWCAYVYIYIYMYSGRSYISARLPHQERKLGDRKGLGAHRGKALSSVGYIPDKTHL